MHYCDCCGAPKLHSVMWKGLVLSDQPLSASWEGRSLLLPSADLRVLFELVRWKQVSNDRIFALAPLGEEGLGVGTVHERIRRVRRALEAAGCPLRIRSKYGWGYYIGGEL